MTTRQDIKDWLDEAKPEHTHMLVVCDTFDYDDYHVHTSDVHESIKHYRNASMQRIMEVYDLAKNTEEQLDEHRAWNV